MLECSVVVDSEPVDRGTVSLAPSTHQSIAELEQSQTGRTTIKNTLLALRSNVGRFETKCEQANSIELVVITCLRR